MVDALIRLMNSPDEFTGPVNVGNPSEIRIDELAKLIIAMTGSKSELVFHPLPSDDPLQRQPDISLAKATLSWAPSVLLQDGLLKTIDYFRSRFGP